MASIYPTAIDLGQNYNPPSLPPENQDNFGSEQYPDAKKGSGNGGGCSGGGLDVSAPGDLDRTRIIRIGPPPTRHSKVLTSKGLRDRRIRLSVGTAIQFYELQDRLGYDQPSKAVEWLLKVAASSFVELASIDTSFVNISQHLSDDKWSSTGSNRGFDLAETEMEGDGICGSNILQHNPSFSNSMEPSSWHILPMSAEQNLCRGDHHLCSLNLPALPVPQQNNVLNVAQGPATSQHLDQLKNLPATSLGSVCQPQPELSSSSSLLLSQFRQLLRNATYSNLSTFSNQLMSFGGASQEGEVQSAEENCEDKMDV